MFKLAESLLGALKDIGILPRAAFSDACEVTQENFETSIDSYRAAAEDGIGTMAYKSKLGRDSAEILRAIRSHDHTSSNWVDGTASMLATLRSNSQKAQEMLSDVPGDIVVDGTTYSRMNLLRYIATASAVSRYARAYLHHLLLAEETHLRIADDARPPAEVRWVETNFRGYCDAIRYMNLPTAEFLRIINAIPEIQFIDNTQEEDVVSNVGVGALQPIRFGFIPPDYNLFYVMGVRWVNYRAARHDAAVRERDAIVHHLMRLRNANGGIRNPQTDKAISVYESDLTLINAKIADMEEQHAHN